MVALEQQQEPGRTRFSWRCNNYPDTNRRDFDILIITLLKIVENSPGQVRKNRSTAHESYSNGIVLFPETSRDLTVLVRSEYRCRQAKTRMCNDCISKVTEVRLVLTAILEPESRRCRRTM